MTTTPFTTPTATTRSLPLASVLATDASVPLAITRIALGAVILPHGMQKTVGWFGGYGYGATMDAFTAMGIPALLAFLAIVAESAGTLALLAGFTTRIAAVGIGSVMVVAGVMHRANGFFMNWSGAQAGEGFEFHILAIAMATVLVIGGGGRFSLDRLIARRA